ncbi:MAG TPA: serine/threonine-protein kinase [Planctomycetaceae bacterium]|nr:serine/threonine-protein kinase [Planctomycetaceae bacterium]
MGDDLQLHASSAEPADSVEAAWANPGEPPDLIALLADHPRWSSRDLRVALLVDQQFRALTSQPWSTEDYLRLIPAQAVNDDLVLDLIYSECRSRSRHDAAPKLEEMVHRFPHLATRLKRQLEIASWFADAPAIDSQPTDEDSTDSRDPLATRFGDYEIFEEIARGGMGVIYRARHRKLKRIVALKMIRPERLMRFADLRRFKNETRIIAQLDHPHIIPILHVDKFDGIHFFTMRMIEGRDLEARRTEYLNDLRSAAQLVAAVATAIHYAHQHGVLHRDLKPSNVLVDQTGMPFVVDFGLASRMSELTNLIQPEEFRGTPAYAAPEILQEHAPPPNVAADVYGLGAILYVLMTGQAPFDGLNSVEIWSRIRDSEPPSPRTLNPRVSPDLEAICLKALDKNPAARYESAAALEEDLRRFLAGESVVARPVLWWQRRWRWFRKHSARAALALTAAVAVLGMLAVIVVQAISLHEQVKQTESARQEADTYRQALEHAGEKAEQLQADTAADQPRSGEVP